MSVQRLPECRDRIGSPAYQLEAGLRHAVSENVSIFGEYRWTQSEASKISGGGATAHQNFSNNALLAGVTYHLGE